MNDTDDLVVTAQKQLDEHRTWLRGELMKLGAAEGPRQDAKWVILTNQVQEIQLRMARCTSRRVISVVWDYPDELYAFLTSNLAPKHLRDSLTGGHKLDPSQPAASIRLATPEDEEEPRGKGR